MAYIWCDYGTAALMNCEKETKRTSFAKKYFTNYTKNDTINLHESRIFAWEKDKGFTVDIGIVSLGDRTVNQTVKLVGTADDGQWDAYLII